MQLSEKELLMIGEAAIGHMSAIEKFRFYSQACTDQEMKQLINSHISRLEQHRQSPMSLIQTGSYQYGSTAQSQQTAQQYGGQYGVQYGSTQYGGSEYQGVQYISGQYAGQYEGAYGGQPGAAVQQQGQKRYQ
ncbi:MAG TPA: hypothetical protein DEA47_05865 [Peptococcaceae bacterium]|nr:MAG: hypothetical protein XD50_0804 [Clostridia bacterium 41_269]HBT20868.1 hypothetical protein [Peptococcaceae bacterium]